MEEERERVPYPEPLSCKRDWRLKARSSRKPLRSSSDTASLIRSPSSTTWRVRAPSKPVASRRPIKKRKKRYTSRSPFSPFSPGS